MKMMMTTTIPRKVAEARAVVAVVKAVEVDLAPKVVREATITIQRIITIPMRTTMTTTVLEKIAAASQVRVVDQDLAASQVKVADPEVNQGVVADLAADLAAAAVTLMQIRTKTLTSIPTNILPMESVAVPRVVSARDQDQVKAEVEAVQDQARAEADQVREDQARDQQRVLHTTMTMTTTTTTARTVVAMESPTRQIYKGSIDGG